MLEIEPTELLDEVDILIKNASDSSENVISMYRDGDVTIELVDITVSFLFAEAEQIYILEMIQQKLHTFITRVLLILMKISVKA